MANDDEVKRAETALRIAQLKFRQMLRKDEDANASSRTPFESASQFCKDLDAVLNQNTPKNVQTCKDWIMKHIAPFKARVAILGGYLVAVSRSIVVDPASKSTKATRNRLDILLVVSDVLHANNFHRPHGAAQGLVARELRPYLEELAELAGLSITSKDSPYEKKLKAVINFWAVNQCISIEDFDSIRERATNGLVVAQGGSPLRKRTYALPDWFGDRTAPWHELPASYMLEPMLKHPDHPIDRSEITVKRFDAKQPSEHVRKLLQEYFENIDLKYMPTGDNLTGETKKYKLWLDPMGQLVKQNKETGEINTVCNGYGWSTKFCEEMQEYGVPGVINEAREEYRNKMQDRLLNERDRSRSPSPGRRRYSTDSEMDGYRRHSRSSSRSPFDGRVDRPRSRDSERYDDRRLRSSNDDDGNSNERSRLDDRRDLERRQPPPTQYGCDAAPPRPSRWNDSNIYNKPSPSSYSGPGGNNYNSSYGQGFSQLSLPVNNPLAVPPPPPMAGQFSGYPMPFPPPPPPPVQAAGGPVPPPPPPQPNFSGSYPNAPNMGGFPNNPYNYGSNNDQAYGNNSGYGAQNQGNFRGSFGGGFQARGSYNRGGYNGSQHGRSGGSR